MHLKEMVDHFPKRSKPVRTMQEEFPGHKQVPNTQTTETKTDTVPPLFFFFFFFFLLSLSVLIYKVVEGLQWYYGSYGGV